MPNQRSKNKGYISAHVDEQKLHDFDEKWLKAGYPNRTAAIDALITLAISDKPKVDALLRIVGKG
jgi:hypothetical protein